MGLCRLFHLMGQRLSYPSQLRDETGNRNSLLGVPVNRGAYDTQLEGADKDLKISKTACFLFFFDGLSQGGRLLDKRPESTIV